MIEQSESGLNSAQYQVFQTSQTNHTYRVELHRYDPDFSLFFENDLDVHGSAYAADASETHVIRVHGTGYYERLTTTVVGGTHAFSFGTPSSVSLRYRDGVWYWYMAGSFGVYRCTSSNNGATWTAWTQVIGSATLLVAGVGNEYFRVSQNSNGNGILSFHSASGSSSVTFCSVPRSLDAVFWQGKNICVVAMDIPGRTTMTIENGNPVRYVTRSGGILAFTATSAAISEETEVDIVDRYTVFRYRESVRLSRLADKLVAVCAASDGNEEVNYRTYRYYTSGDGVSWSRGFVLHDIEASYRRPLTLLWRAARLYALDRRRIFQSPATYFTGNSTVVHDITSRVLSYQSQQGDMRQSSAVLSNEDGFFDAFMGQDQTWLIQTYMGFNGVGVVQQSVEEIDAWTEEMGVRGPEYMRTVRIVARDLLSWLTDDAVNEEPKYWRSQLVGADVYVDTTGSGYGGMAHTATQAGSWRTVDNTLLLVANDEEGVAFNTFDSAIWNGAVEYGIRLSVPNNNEYAGVCFRALDKDNLWAAWYHQTSDRIQLVRRMNGATTVVAESAPCGWTSAILTNWRFIRVRFRYAAIRVDISNDGVVWTTVIDYIMPGNRVITGGGEVLRDRFIERGFVGCIGKGRSTMSYWETPGYTSTIEFLDWSPTELRPSVEPGIQENTTQRLTRLAWVDDQDPRRVYRALLVAGSSNTITLTDISPPAALRDEIGTILEIFVAPWDAKRGYLYGERGILYAADIWSGTPNWRLACQYPPVSYGRGTTFTGLDTDNVGVAPKGCAGRRGFWIWSSGDFLYISTDDFATYDVKQLDFHVYSIAVGPYNRGRRGDIYIGAGGNKPGLYYSRNWGRSFDLHRQSLSVTGGRVRPDVWTWVDIPYRTPEGKPNVRHQGVRGACAKYERADLNSPVQPGWWRFTLDLRTSMTSSFGYWWAPSLYYPYFTGAGDGQIYGINHTFADRYVLGSGKRSGDVAGFQSSTLQANSAHFAFTPQPFIQPQNLRLRVYHSLEFLNRTEGEVDFVLVTASLFLDGNRSVQGVTYTSNQGDNFLSVVYNFDRRGTGRRLNGIEVQVQPRWETTSRLYFPNPFATIPIRYSRFPLIDSYIHRVELEGDGTPPDGLPVTTGGSGNDDFWRVYNFDLAASPEASVMSPSANADTDALLPIWYRHGRAAYTRARERGWIVAPMDNLTVSNNFTSDAAAIDYHWMFATPTSVHGSWSGKRLLHAPSTYLATVSNVFGVVNNPDFMGVFLRPTDDRRATSPGGPQATRLLITTNNWATHEDWSSALAAAYGGTAPAVLSVVGDMSTIQIIPPEDETFLDDDLPPVPTDDWLDDSPGLGVWLPGPEHALSFCRARVYDRSPVTTVEEAIRHAASYAGVHRFKFFNAQDSSTASSVHSGVSIFSEPLDHNYKVSFRTNALQNVRLYLNLRAPGAAALTSVHYRVRLNAPQLEIEKYVPGSGYATVLYSPLSLSGPGSITVGVRETIMRSIQGNVWLLITIYRDGELLETYAEWIKRSPDTDYYVGIVGAHSDWRIAQLTEIVEWVTQDPGTPVMSGLQRTLDGRNIRMAMRFDGSLVAWRQRPRTPSLTLQASDIEALQRTVDHRARFTHVRMVGAYLEAEALRSNRGRHRFVEVKNPYLMTTPECYREAVRQLNRFDQNMDTLAAVTSLRPLLEVGDRIEVIDQSYFVEGYSVQVTPAQVEATYNLKRYTGAS
jgi:hypothetical protein